MKKLVLAILTSAFLGSCATSNIATSKKNVIEVDINLNNVVDDKVQVSVNPQKIKEEVVVYQMPKIVPGTYVVSDYGKFVSDFKAYDYDGKEMPVFLRQKQRCCLKFSIEQ